MPKALHAETWPPRPCLSFLAYNPDYDSMGFWTHINSFLEDRTFVAEQQALAYLAAPDLLFGGLSDDEGVHLVARPTRRRKARQQHAGQAQGFKEGERPGGLLREACGTPTDSLRSGSRPGWLGGREWASGSPLQRRADERGKERRVLSTPRRRPRSGHDELMSPASPRPLRPKSAGKEPSGLDRDSKLHRRPWCAPGVFHPLPALQDPSPARRSPAPPEHQPTGGGDAGTPLAQRRHHPLPEGPSPDERHRAPLRTRVAQQPSKHSTHGDDARPHAGATLRLIRALKDLGSEVWRGSDGGDKSDPPREAGGHGARDGAGAACLHGGGRGDGVSAVVGAGRGGSPFPSPPNRVEARHLELEKKLAEAERRAREAEATLAQEDHRQLQQAVVQTKLEMEAQAREIRELRLLLDASSPSLHEEARGRLPSHTRSSSIESPRSQTSVHYLPESPSRSSTEAAGAGTMPSHLSQESVQHQRAGTPGGVGATRSPAAAAPAHGKDAGGHDGGRAEAQRGPGSSSEPQQALGADGGALGGGGLGEQAAAANDEGSGAKGGGVGGAPAAHRPAHPAPGGEASQQAVGAGGAMRNSAPPDSPPHPSRPGAGSWAGGAAAAVDEVEVLRRKLEAAYELAEMMSEEAAEADEKWREAEKRAARVQGGEEVLVELIQLKERFEKADSELLLLGAQEQIRALRRQCDAMNSALHKVQHKIGKF